jgi:hypothetical protein
MTENILDAKSDLFVRAYYGAVMTTRGGFNSVLDARLALNHVQEN